MASLPNSASRFRLPTEALVIIAVLGCGCGGDDATCGPAGAEPGITVATATVSATFSTFTASANNDCPNVGSPTAVTIAGSQDGASGSIILCLSRPENVGSSAIDVDFSGALQLVSVSAQLDCPVVVDRSQPLDLKATFEGFCADGVDPAGFTLALDGQVAMRKQCNGQAEEAITVTVSGSAPVAAE